MNTRLALAIKHGNLFRKKKDIAGKLRLLACITLFFSAIAIHTADTRRMMEMAQGTMTAVQDRLGLTLLADANASLSRAMHATLEVKRLMAASVQILFTPNLKLPEQTVNKILLSIDQIYSDVLLGPLHVQPSIISELSKARELVTTFQHMLDDSLRSFDQGRAVGAYSGHLSSLSPHLNMTAAHVPHQTEMGRGAHAVSQLYGVGATELPQMPMPSFLQSTGSESYPTGALSQFSVPAVPPRVPMPAVDLLTPSLNAPANLYSDMCCTGRAEQCTELPPSCLGVQFNEDLQEGDNLSAAAISDPFGRASKRRRTEGLTEESAHLQTSVRGEESVPAQLFPVLQEPTVPVASVRGFLPQLDTVSHGLENNCGSASSSSSSKHGLLGVAALNLPRQSSEATRLEAPPGLDAPLNPERGQGRHYQCIRCKSCFMSKYNLLQHSKKQHPGDKVSSCSCAYCCITFLLNGRSFSKHLRSQHKDKLLTCDWCFQSFTRRDNLNVHRRVCATSQLPQGGELPIDGNNPREVAQLAMMARAASGAPLLATGQKEGKHYRCKGCDLRFASKRGLLDHGNKKHSNDGPINEYRCTYCDCSFETGSSLFLDHLRDKHKAQLFSCGMCSATFQTHTGLKRHANSHAEGESFTCSSCPRTFAQRSNLLRHQRIHAGESPFRCKFCTYAARQSTHLRKHLKNKHGLDTTGSDWMKQYGMVSLQGASSR